MDLFSKFEKKGLRIIPNNKKVTWADSFEVVLILQINLFIFFVFTLNIYEWKQSTFFVMPVIS